MARPRRERAALSRMVERIEFDPATAAGQIHYRIGAVRTGRFHVRNAAQLGVEGYDWRPMVTRVIPRSCLRSG